MDKDRIANFAGNVYRDMAGAMAMGMAFVGVRTGLFRAMSGQGPMTCEQVVGKSGLQTRYVEEWLAGMTTAGYLDYNPAAGTFELADEHAYLLASEGTDHFMGGLFHFAPVLLGVAPKVADAFKTGGGVRFDEFGPDCIAALDLLNRGTYEQRLASYWLTQMPRVVERLESGGTVLDVGCGVGRVSATIARAFPDCRVTGLDPDAESIRQARIEAESAGLDDRIDFVAETTASYRPDRPFDLITAADCVHDFAEPVKTLEEIRGLLAPGGTLFIVEPRAADRLEDNVNPLGAVYYGFSLFHCMTQSLAEGGAGLGTCMGPERTEALAREAGYGRFEQLGIKSQTNLFYAAGH